MAPRKPIPAPVKCRATAKHTGQRCQRWAVPGSALCKHHGAFGGPRGGRAAAEDQHAARRIEAVVTDIASRAMLAAGFPAEVVEMAGGQVPTPEPDEESTPSGDLVTREDEESAVDRGMARLAGALTRQLQAIAAELAGAQAQAAASRPATISGEVVDVPERDPVADDIEHLEARPTAKRMAKAAELRHLRERAEGEPEPVASPPAEPEPAEPLTLKRQSAVTPEPKPEAPGPWKLRRANVPGPRRDHAGRVTTTLGSQPSSYRDYH